MIIYLEPKWPLVLKVNPSKQWRPFPINQNKGHLGYRYIYIYIHLTIFEGFVSQSGLAFGSCILTVFGIFVDLASFRRIPGVDMKGWWGPRKNIRKKSTGRFDVEILNHDNFKPSNMFNISNLSGLKMKTNPHEFLRYFWVFLGRAHKTSQIQQPSHRRSCWEDPWARQVQSMAKAQGPPVRTRDAMQE